MTRRRLLSECDSEELSEWLAYEKVYGLSDGNFVAGVVAAAIANHAPFTKRKEAATAADFVPLFATAPRRRRQTPEEMRRNLAAFGGGKPAGRV